MPVYEYACRRCGHAFELIVFASTVPVCPACTSADLEKQLSVFAGVAKQPGPPRMRGRKGYVADDHQNPSKACPVNERD
jgi:putative FmdB family regulatory protein